MTNPTTPSAEIQKLLKKLESTSVTDGDAAVNLVRLLAYIRTLEKEHRAMREELEENKLDWWSLMGAALNTDDEGNPCQLMPIHKDIKSYCDAKLKRIKNLLSSITIHD